MTDPVLTPTTHQTAQWSKRGPAVYLAVRAVLDGVDHLAVEMERKWGVDRLRLLVPAELRERFDRQRAKLNRAIWHGDLADIEREGPRMITAWRVLDAEAEKAGATPLSHTLVVYETALSDGTVIAIVHDRTAAHALQADGRRRQVWSLDEIARCIEAFPAVVKAKDTFAGATVVMTRPPGDPLDGIAVGHDEIPF